VQIKDILLKRLAEMNHPICSSAVSYCAKKVAASAGDMRAALDIYRRAIDIAISRCEPKDEQTFSKPRKALDDLSGCMNNMNDRLSEQIAVDIKDVMQALSLIAQGSSKGTIGKLNSLSIHQKAALCVLVSLKGSASTITISDIFDRYQQICLDGHLLDPLQRVEFYDVITSLQTIGALSLQKQSRTARTTSVFLNVSDFEVLKSTTGVSILAKMMK